MKFGTEGRDERPDDSFEEKYEVEEPIQCGLIGLSWPLTHSPSCSQVLPSEGEAAEEEVLDVPELLGLANTLTNPNNRKWKSSPKTEL